MASSPPPLLPSFDEITRVGNNTSPLPLSSRAQTKSLATLFSIGVEIAGLNEKGIDKGKCIGGNDDGIGVEIGAGIVAGIGAEIVAGIGVGTGVGNVIRIGAGIVVGIGAETGAGNVARIGAGTGAGNAAGTSAGKVAEIGAVAGIGAMAGIGTRNVAENVAETTAGNGVHEC
ncbi:hypothetical protein Pfo_007996 [Paulownia fortunei]|nr:hypothetical protein Pfo_007996 [Paulownia fortunei]